MDCKKYFDLISARLDGELTQSEETDLTAHLQECPACRAIVKDMEGLHSVLTQAGEVDAPPALSQTAMQKIKAERLASRRRFVRRISGLAACLVLCVTAWYVTLPDFNSDPQVLSDAWNADTASLHEKGRAVSSPCDKQRLSSLDAPAAPSAHLLTGADSLSEFLTRFPDTDLSAVSAAYNEDFFLTKHLLAVVLQEPSSSITHTISEITADQVTVLRHIPEAGDSDMAPWLLLTPTQLDGPDRTLVVELIDT